MAFISTPVALEAIGFETGQHIGNIKHALGAQMIGFMSMFFYTFLPLLPYNYTGAQKVGNLALIFEFEALLSKQSNRSATQNKIMECQ